MAKRGAHALQAHAAGMQKACCSVLQYIAVCCSMLQCALQEHMRQVQQWESVLTWLSSGIHIGVHIQSRSRRVSAAGADSKLMLASSRAGEFGTGSLFGLTHCASCSTCLHSLQPSAKSSGFAKTRYVSPTPHV